MEKIKVELLQEHEHAGLVHPVGAKLELDDELLVPIPAEDCPK